ncbi:MULTISPECIES: SVM family protein [Candidatus Phytoplasma]|uniref:Effector n=2 Tax=Candidatus Phytoplasma TaxID=33926 RepID=A0ABN0J7N4_PEWBP|nr:MULTISPECIES: SVM family protein [Phytoplasma]QLL36824.1 putative secreted protein, AYWB SAP30-like ['Echinacea purpurea' witches'-broom phytoplasma]WEX20505.1 MAG: putative secreted protein, SAP30-like [Candidatus Phytoplasma aurantifolia]WKV64070.1 MAG: putative secreted protein, AYWB SAP30-like [Candidatus Phytoplasma australasiaticum]EMR14466.1 putative effector [Peanut witches'-broom phytoplasma NTU2011]MDO8052809.1 SVM family protein ['Vigna radiata' phytoplasma]
MIQIKNKLYLLPLFLINYLGLFLLINIHPVMAADNNKNQQKEDYDLVDKAINDLNEGIEYFNKKGIQINLTRITKLISTKQKRNNKTENSSSSSKKIKK